VKAKHVRGVGMSSRFNDFSTRRKRRWCNIIPAMVLLLCVAGIVLLMTVPR
jgi:hypothetical protein